MKVILLFLVIKANDAKVIFFYINPSTDEKKAKTLELKSIHLMFLFEIKRNKTFNKMEIWVSRSKI